MAILTAVLIPFNETTLTSECHNCREADESLWLLRVERSVLFPRLISHTTVLQLLLCVSPRLLLTRERLQV